MDLPEIQVFVQVKWCKHMDKNMDTRKSLRFHVKTNVINTWGMALTASQVNYVSGTNTSSPSAISTVPVTLAVGSP